MDDPKREFLRRWSGTFEDLVIFKMMHKGKVGAAYVRLAKVPRAAEVLVEHLRTRGDASTLEAAVALAGRLGETASLDLLERLWDQLRSRAVSQQPHIAMESQSGVLALVMAASRWAQHDRSRQQGLAMARTLVERTIDHTDGEFWSSATYALCTLGHHLAQGYDALLERFTTFANGDPPDHLMYPDLTSERSCARALAAKHPAAVQRTAQVLAKEDEAGSIRMNEVLTAAFDEWLEIGRQIS
jgi:hypothetical protein